MGSDILYGVAKPGIPGNGICLRLRSVGLCVRTLGAVDTRTDSGEATGPWTVLYLDIELCLEGDLSEKTSRRRLELETSAGDILPIFGWTV
jgi:hypothetical protein